MKKYILCLANSHKYNERCIAGVEMINKGGDKFYLNKSEEKIKWFRPISFSQHGEISSEIAEQMKILDIFEIEIIKECPMGYQSENVIIDEKSFKFIKSVVPEKEKLDGIISEKMSYIFLNQEKSISKDTIHLVGNSLVFICPETFRFIKVSNKYVKNQLRTEFLFNHLEYNLPITDVEFLERFKKNPDFIHELKSIYFTISLGLEFNGWHYKLVAGVISI